MDLHTIESSLAGLPEKVRFIGVIRYLWTHVYSSLKCIYYCVKGTLCDIKTISKTRLFPSSFFVINLSYFYKINLLVVGCFINRPIYWLGAFLCYILATICNWLEFIGLYSYCKIYQYKYLTNSDLHTLKNN